MKKMSLIAIIGFVLNLIVCFSAFAGYAGDCTQFLGTWEVYQFFAVNSTPIVDYSNEEPMAYWYIDYADRDIATGTYKSTYGHIKTISISWSLDKAVFIIANGNNVSDDLNKYTLNNDTAKTETYSLWWSLRKEYWKYIVVAKKIISDVQYTPTVKTELATSITGTSAILNAIINPNGEPTTYFFEYGTTINLFGIVTYDAETSINNLEAGTINQSVAINLTGLDANTTYYFRIVAENSIGVSIGEKQSFTTTDSNADIIIFPEVTTNNASEVDINTVTLNGAINPNGLDIDYYFEYGETETFGNNSILQHLSSGTSAIIEVAADITELTPNTAYYYRLVTVSSSGIITGEIHTFQTLQQATDTVSLDENLFMIIPNITLNKELLNIRLNLEFYHNPFDSLIWKMKDTTQCNTELSSEISISTDYKISFTEFIYQNKIMSFPVTLEPYFNKEDPFVLYWKLVM